MAQNPGTQDHEGHQDGLYNQCSTCLCRQFIEQFLTTGEIDSVCERPWAGCLTCGWAGLPETFHWNKVTGSQVLLSEHMMVE